MREYPFYHYVIALIQISRYHLHILEHVNLPARHSISVSSASAMCNHSYSCHLVFWDQLEKIEVEKQEMTSDSFAYLNLKSLQHLSSTPPTSPGSC